MSSALSILQRIGPLIQVCKSFLIKSRTTEIQGKKKRMGKGVRGEDIKDIKLLISFFFFLSEFSGFFLPSCSKKVPSLH